MRKLPLKEPEDRLWARVTKTFLLIALTSLSAGYGPLSEGTNSGQIARSVKQSLREDLADHSCQFSCRAADWSSMSVAQVPMQLKPGWATCGGPLRTTRCSRVFSTTSLRRSSKRPYHINTIACRIDPCHQTEHSCYFQEVHRQVQPQLITIRSGYCAPVVRRDIYGLACLFLMTFSRLTQM